MSVLAPSLLAAVAGLVFIWLLVVFNASKRTAIFCGVLLLAVFMLYAVNLICYVLF